MKKTVIIILAAVIFVAGLSLFAYPLINREMINSSAESELDVFREMREIQTSATPKATENQIISTQKKVQETSTYIDFDKLRADMKSYNLKIFKEGQSGLSDAWSYEQSGFDLSAYGLHNSVAGELRIPRMNSDLPLYLGATTYNMSKGVAQLGQTSMPIGGRNTNCVIAGHRGSAGGEFFKEIQLLQVGDKVYLDNYWETLTYQVEKIEIILPDEIDKVLIQKNKDMITLVTCHPYPDNTHRYVVFCERTENDPIAETTESIETEIVTENTTETTKPTQISATNTETEETIESTSQYLINFENATYIAVPICLILLIIVLIIIKKKK